MPRASKHRGKHKPIYSRHEHGLSGHKICLITAIDENDNMLFKIAGLGAESQEKPEPFRKHFKAGSMIICDDKACIKNFASNNDMTSDVIPSLANQTRFTTDKGNSLSSVNELHTEAKNLIRQKHGISTRHFQGYLDWILFRKRLRYTLEMTKWKSAAYMDTMQELIPFTAGDKEALSDEQVVLLLDSIKGLPPYVFVMLGLYAGLRREEILALKWDCVFLDVEAPYLSVRRAWHTEHNRPVILTELKTKAANRDVPLPKCLVECLKEAKEKSTSEYVVANSEGEPLSYTQFKRVWQYIVTRSTKERTYVRYVNGEKIKHTISPVLGEVAPHNGKVTYSMDFQVTPHQLRHTYITNLIYAQVDPKTVQYLAGHENSKITMDIYAKVKYNKPKELAAVVNGAFGQ